MRRTAAFVMMVACALARCSAEAEPESDQRVGVLIGGAGPLPAAIQGMHYRAGSRTGYTDETGAFPYRVGEQIQFSVGPLRFEPVPGAPAVSPFQLANGSGCAVGDALTKVLQALQSSD